MKLNLLFLCTVLAVAVGGCQNASRTRSASTDADGTPPPVHAHQSLDHATSEITSGS